MSEFSVLKHYFVLFLFLFYLVSFVFQPIIIYSIKYTKKLMYNILFLISNFYFYAQQCSYNACILLLIFIHYYASFLIDLCDGVICENEGTCVGGLLNNSCICPVSHTGSHCESGNVKSVRIWFEVENISCKLEGFNYK